MASYFCDQADELVLLVTADILTYTNRYLHQKYVNKVRHKGIGKGKNNFFPWIAAST